MTGSGKFAILATRWPVDLISVGMHGPRHTPGSTRRTFKWLSELSYLTVPVDVAAMNEVCAQSREDWSVQHTKVTLMKLDDHQITAFMMAPASGFRAGLKATQGN